MGVHWKIQLLGGGGVTKNQNKGGIAKKGAWIVCQFKGDFARKRGWCFWGGVDAPMHTMVTHKFCGLHKNWFHSLTFYSLQSFSLRDKASEVRQICIFV